MTSVPHSGAKSVTPGGSVAGGHTPGPWIALGDRVVSEATWDTVAATGYGTNGARTLAVGAVATTAEEHANARLIAAAPELLEAALLAEGILGNDLLREQMSGDGDYEALTAAVAQLQKAIAKATAGETRNAEPIQSEGAR